MMTLARSPASPSAAAAVADASSASYVGYRRRPLRVGAATAATSSSPSPPRRRLGLGRPRPLDILVVCLALVIFVATDDRRNGLLAADAFSPAGPSTSGGARTSSAFLAFLGPPVPPPIGSINTSSSSRRAHSCFGTTTILRAAAGDDATQFPEEDDDTVVIPDFIASPVLRQAYPSLVSHVAEYGHPNIPLGSADGRRCYTLRRLAFQGKLSDDEISLLEGMGFRFRSFEEVYDEADFDDCLDRLLAYEAQYKTGYQIPKKFAPDPELGAWVTLVRRRGRDSTIAPDRREKLDRIGFAWESTRKCGSAFMSAYQALKGRVEGAKAKEADADADADGANGGDSESASAAEILREEDAAKWLRAQREAYKNGKLSESRVEYLDELTEGTGVEWR